MDLTALILAHPRVLANTFDPTKRESLASIFIKAFDDKGQKYPIDFDEAWEFCGYSTKGNGSRKLKEQFQLDVDYIHKKGQPFITGEKRSAERRSMPDKYYLSTNAFENFAMCAPGERGKAVRGFFIAIKDAYIECTRSKDPIGPKEKAMLLLHENKKCLYVGAVQQQPTKLFKFGRTTNLGRRYKEHKATFKEPLFFELLHVVEAEDDRKAEELFRNMGDIKDNITPLRIGDITHTEIFVAPATLNNDKIMHNMRKAARLATSPDLLMADGCDREILAEQQKTKQQEAMAKAAEAEERRQAHRLEEVRIIEQAKLEKAKLDHAYRMEQLKRESESLEVHTEGEPKRQKENLASEEPVILPNQANTPLSTVHQAIDAFLLQYCELGVHDPRDERDKRFRAKKCDLFKLFYEAGYQNFEEQEFDSDMLARSGITLHAINWTGYRTFRAWLGVRLKEEFRV
jgi:hypothetical protein